MANNNLTADIIAREAVMILENNTVMADLVYRGYEDEYDKNINGYKVGASVRIRRPTDFTVRTGSTASLQDVSEGSLSFTVNKQRGVDFQFTTQELSLNIGQLSERVLRPAMVQLANQVDRDILSLYTDVWHHVPQPYGTNGTTTWNATSTIGTIDSFADFSKGPERLDLQAAPQNDRYAVMSPPDVWAMMGAQTALYIQDAAKQAYRQGKLGTIGNVDTYSSQNVQAHVAGSRPFNTTVINGANQTTSWSSTSTLQNLAVDGAGTSFTYNQGDVFTINGVFAVNPVTKATLTYLQPFVVMSTTSSVAAAGGTATLSISPPIIASGAFQTVSAAPADNATLTFSIGASGTVNSNLVFQKNAFGLVMVPMEMPPGAYGGSRASYRGMSVRVQPFYTGTSDISAWRLDILYGVKTIDPRLATRINAP